VGTPIFRGGADTLLHPVLPVLERPFVPLYRNLPPAPSSPIIVDR